MSRKRTFGAIVLAALALTGCGDGGGDSPSDTTADTAGGASTTASEGAADGATVTLKNVKFNPEQITVEKGETVTWQWDDGSIPHDVDGGSAFKSEIQEEGTFEHTFDEAGKFDYKCTVHPTMTGSVQVTE